LSRARCGAPRPCRLIVKCDGLVMVVGVGGGGLSVIALHD
jgi:hypothetical protein